MSRNGFRYKDREDQEHCQREDQEGRGGREGLSRRRRTLSLSLSKRSSTAITKSLQEKDNLILYLTQYLQEKDNVILSLKNEKDAITLKKEKDAITLKEEKEKDIIDI